MRKRKENSMSVEEAAKVLEKSPQNVRFGLQQQKLPIGTAWQKPNGRWTYSIVRNKVYEYMGIREVITNEN